MNLFSLSRKDPINNTAELFSSKGEKMQISFGKRKLNSYNHTPISIPK